MNLEQLELLSKQRIAIPDDMECDQYSADGLFNFLAKNNGLTEEFIYNNENPLTLQLPVYTASYEPIGYIPIDASKNGKPLKTCMGETIIIFRQGYAGLMYIPKEDMFFASEHTIPIQVKPELKEKLNQHWFAKYYQPDVMHYVTGKADSGNFSQLAFQKMHFQIPPIKWQNECAELYIKLEDELKKIKENISGLSLNKKPSKGLSDEELIEKYESGAIDLGKKLKKAIGKR